MKDKNKTVMTYLTRFGMATLAIALIVGCDSNGGSTSSVRVIDTEDDLDGDKERLSYALGLYFGSQSVIFEDLDVGLIASGIKDGYNEKEGVIFDQQTIGEIIISSQQQAVNEQKDKSSVASKEFLAENAKDERFTILDSGVRYRVIEEGTGAIPEASDEVEVHYEGTLISGEVFDSSIQRNQTATFPVLGVIEGWQEALQLMPVGSTWEVVIPSELAYGEQGNSRIGPNEVLIFQINLIDIK